MNDVKQFFNDLYRDLSDRHLLLPAIGLIVAIIAVPMLLGSSPVATPPPAAPPVATEDATEVEPAVLATDSGIRDYSQRLEALKEKNPFVQQFAAPEAATEDAGAATTDPGAVPGATDTGVPTDTTGVPTDTSGTAVPGSDDRTTTPTTPTEPTQPDIQTRFFAPRIDVSFGELGDAKQIDDVRHFDFLPNEKTPVVAFLGLGESADKAVFAVSNEVAETSGEGSCSPHEADGCDLLILRIGQQRTLKVEAPGPYGESTTFRLKLLETHFTRVPDPRDEAQSDTSG